MSGVNREALRAPVQSERGGRRADKPSGTISWVEHEEAYAAYAARFGRGQSAERIAQRGGFGYWELANLLRREPTTWTAVNR